MRQFIGVLFIIGLIANDSVQGQPVNQASTNNIPLRCYVMTVRLIGQKAAQSGVLFDLTDSSVVLAPITADMKPTVRSLIRHHNGKLPPIDSLRTSLLLRTYRYDNISRLVLYRGGYGGKGFLIGAGVGVLAGFIHGGDKSGLIRLPASTYALVLGVPLSFVGAIVGAISTKSVNAREQSVAAEVPSRFRNFTIVEQVNQATLYTP
jgi:hypothetical protein